MKNNIVKFLYNFAPMLLSLVLMQLVVLPELYRRDVELYIAFNYFMYVPLLFIHVLNTACYNVAVLKEKDDRFDISNFFYVALAYIIISSIGALFIESINFKVFIFLCSLVMADTAMNLLRLAEKDRLIAKMLIIQSSIFLLLFYVNVDVFISYSVANVFSCLYAGISLYNCRIFNFYYRTLAGFSAVSLLSSAIPTINRYIDKVFVLVALSAAVSVNVLPVLSICGLIMLPTSAATKVIIRSFSFSGSLTKILLLMLLFSPVLFLSLYFATDIGLGLVYGIDVDKFILIAICVLKTISLAELFLFSILANRVDMGHVAAKTGRYLCLIFFTMISILWVFDIKLVEQSIWLLPLYVMLTLSMLLISTRGKNESFV